jgi:hypothetical protein
VADEGERVTTPDLDDWFRTVSGRRMRVTAPDPELIVIEDIAAHLSMICRFGGMVKSLYSVAQHSVMVSELVPPGNPYLAQQALLHDATEAYLNDVIRPVKQLLPSYANLEELWAKAITARFGVDVVHLPAAVKLADSRACLTEQFHLRGPEFLEGKETDGV